MALDNKIDNKNSRLIGTYSEGIEGPLVFVVAGMHGNEHAGIKAAEWLLKMLEVEHITRPHFLFKGTLVALIGNVEACRQGIRFLERDLNRIWIPSRINALLGGFSAPYCHEELEMIELIREMSTFLSLKNHTQIIVVDLHTTSAKGGIFVVPSESRQSLQLALQLHAPVVTGMIAGIKGAALQYFDALSWGKPAAAISFEAGEHQDPHSVYIAIAALIHILRYAGCINPEDVESRHLQLLEESSRGLPVLSRLAYIHTIEAAENFEMLPGFINFQFLEKGTRLASNDGEPVLCPFDAHLLMPLYQKKGNDGFFLVKADTYYGFFD